MPDAEWGESQLHTAAKAGNEWEVARLIAAGVAVDAGDYRSRTPLHLAAGIAAPEVVAMLLAAGADPMALSTFRTTPLHEVARSAVGAVDARLGIIDRLLAAGCTINAVDSVGRTALWYAAATGTTPLSAEQLTTRGQVLQRLLDHGADPTIAASGLQGRPIDAAQGLHQARKFRVMWAEGVALLENYGH